MYCILLSEFLVMVPAFFSINETNWYRLKQQMKSKLLLIGLCLTMWVLPTWFGGTSLALGQARQGIGVGIINDNTNSTFKFTSDTGYMASNHSLKVESKGNGVVTEYQVILAKYLSYVPFLSVSEQKPSTFTAKGTNSALATTTWKKLKRIDAGIAIRFWAWEYFFFGPNMVFSGITLSNPSQSGDKIHSVFASAQGIEMGVEHRSGLYATVRFSKTNGEFRHGSYQGDNTSAMLSYRF